MTGLVAAPPEWGSLLIEAEVGPSQPVAADHVGEAGALLRLKTGGSLSLDRAARLARYSVPWPLGADELAHPFLAPAAAVFAHWEGRLAFHAGAFVAGGGVWAVVGSRGAGKSTALARLVLLGHDVFADDVLVLDGSVACAAPRAIDLRRDAARRLGAGDPLGVVGTRPRWRVALPACAAELPFRGWMFLEWGARREAVALRASDCLTRLTAALTVRLDAPDPRAMLDLAALPAWTVRRQRDWARLDDGVEQMLELAS